MSRTDEFQYAGHVRNLRRMEFRDFVREGFLQELNRQFLHPLGLALSVILDKEGVEQFGGIQDYRTDAEGMVYDRHYINSAECRHRAEMVAGELAAHRAARTALLGAMVQPIPPLSDPTAAVAIDCGPSCVGINEQVA